MQELMFFDANAKIGHSISGPLPGARELLAEMDRNGVDFALVQHNNLDTIGEVNANREIVELMQEDSAQRLYGVWSILPEQCHELPESGEFFAQMRQNRIKALTLLPTAHRYIACRITVGKMLDEAAERKIPVLLYGVQGDWSAQWGALYNFMEIFPNLHCIINGGHKWGNDRYIRPLLENYPNLRVEISGYWVPEGLRDLVELYGSERILYGSGFPIYNHGNGMLQIKQSGLNMTDIANIAGLNLKKILEDAEI